MPTADKTAEREARLRVLIAEHASAVKTLLAQTERDPAVREELLADVIELAYRRIAELDQLHFYQVRAWLLRTARYMNANASRRAETRRKLLARLEREPMDDASSAEDEVIFQVPEGELSTGVRAALDGLRADYREILIIQSLGQSGPRIAKQLGISEQAARTRLMRARKAFVDAYLRLHGEQATGGPS